MTPRPDPSPRPYGEVAHPENGGTSRMRYAELPFADRLAMVDFRVGTRPHITVDSEVCRACTTQACVHTCPADLFVPTSDGRILFSYEQCFECGTCFQVCAEEGALTWTYPDGGHGVAFRTG